MKVINVMAISCDGKIAAHSKETDLQRSSYGLTGEADQDHVRQLIKNCDHIITGAQSIRASQGARSDKGREGYPTWVVLTRRGLGKNERFWQQKNIPQVLVSPQPVKLYNSHCELLVSHEENIASYTHQRLKERGASQVLLFGGSEVNHLFYAQGLVNELVVTVAPVLFAQRGATPLLANYLEQPVKLSLKSCEASDGFVFLHYKVLG